MVKRIPRGILLLFLLFAFTLADGNVETDTAAAEITPTDDAEEDLKQTDAAVAVTPTDDGATAEENPKSCQVSFPPLPKSALAKKINKESIEAFFDEHMPELMENSKIVGTSLSVVLPDSVVVAKGYGYASLADKISVDPNTTMFRPGSISKLFLWTAIMQMVEQDKVDLTRDICVYLKCQDIPTLSKENNPDAFPNMTLTHLLSHTPGLEDYMFNLFVKDPNKLMNLTEVVSHRVVKRVRPPGAEIAYSNYGSMLAGRIVEEISGLGFEEYVEQHIFEPLGMQYSTFRQPLPAELESHMSEGFAHLVNETTVSKEFELIQGAPAGGLSSSAADMAKFMKAHLDSKDNSILKAETKKQMHSLLFRPHPEFDMGFAHGFMDLSTNNVRVIGHGGDTMYFHSQLFLLEEYGLGVYFSFNTGKEGMPDFVTTKLVSKFMNHFFPAPTGMEIVQEFNSQEQAEECGSFYNLYKMVLDIYEMVMDYVFPPTIDPAITTTELSFDASNYTGIYSGNRRSESDMTKINSLFMIFTVKRPPLNETNQEEHRLLISSFLFPEDQEYIAIGPHLFQAVNGHERILFLFDDDDSSGKAKTIFFHSFPMLYFNRCPWWETQLWNLPVAVLSQLFVISGLFVWPLRPLRRFLVSKFRKGQTAERKKKTLDVVIAEGLAGLVTLVYFAFYGSIIYISTVHDLIYGGSLPMWPFYIPWVALLVGLPLPIFALRGISKRSWGVRYGTYFTLFSISMQFFFWFWWYWGFVADISF